MATLSDYQRDVLVRTMLGEARGEGVEGMADVAQVILNRANSGQYPSDPASVALQPYQFSAWNKGEGGNNPQQFKKSDPIYRQAEQALNAVLSGSRPDYTGGALYYHTPAVSPKWSSSVNQYGTINRNGHVFYPSHPAPPGSLPDTAVATLLDVKRPVSPSMPTPMPQSLQTQRVAQAALSGGNTAPSQNFYQGIYPQQPSSAQINNTVKNAAAGQSKSLSTALQSYVNSGAGVPYSAGTNVATISTRPMSYAGQERATPAAKIPYSAGQTIATIPTVAPKPNGIQQQRQEQLQTRQGTPVRPTVAQPTPAQVQAATGFKLPNTSTQPSGTLKTGERLQAGVYPSNPTPGIRPTLVAGPTPIVGYPTAAGQRPAVGTALSVAPPKVTGFPTSAALRPTALPPKVTPQTVRPQMPVQRPLPVVQPVMRPAYQPPVTNPSIGNTSIARDSSWLNSSGAMRGQSESQSVFGYLKQQAQNAKR